MDRVHVGDFRSADNLRNVEITFAASRGSDTNSFVGKANMERIAVGFRINGNRGDAQFFAGANDPQGDLPAIGYKDFLEHGLGRPLFLPARTDAEKGLAIFDGLAIFREDADDFATLVGFNFV